MIKRINRNKKRSFTENVGGADSRLIIRVTKIRNKIKAVW